MKVLLVITKSDIGGAQVFILNLARSFKKMGIDVEVAAGSGDYLFQELENYNIPYHYLHSLKRDFSIFSSFRFIYDLYTLLRTKRYDIVHLNSSNTLIGTISCHLLKKRPKIVFTFHGLSFLDKNFNISVLIKPFAKLYFNFFLRMVDKPVFVSNLNYKVSIETNITRFGKVIYNGLDKREMNYLTREEARDFFRSKFNITLSNNYLIGSIGRLAYQKNYGFLINIFSLIKEKIPDAKIIIIGDGKKSDKLVKRIYKFGFQNDIFLVGAIKDSYKYIRAFDVFTLPSRYEGLSISLIEAIFADVPVLASDVGGNSEIVNSDQLFKLDNSEDFISKLIKIRQNPMHLVERNNKVKTHFELEKMINEYRDLYESLYK